MQTSSANTLADFHRFLGQQLSDPDADPMTPEEALARWREHQETLAAVREGLADIEAGRTRPAEVLIQELKAGYSLP